MVKFNLVLGFCGNRCWMGIKELRVKLDGNLICCRGDSAFCSQECRQQRMIQDERKEKRCLASNKQGVTTASESQVTAKGESVAAL